MAASNTKGMTTLLLAKLVDQKKLQWEEPVTKVYPNFKLDDETITQQIEIRHLICACTGMPRQDFEWLFEYKKFKPESTFTSICGRQFQPFGSRPPQDGELLSQGEVFQSQLARGFKH
jgi:CubicO group peptidase (beta-lactamase class C family)